MHISSKNINASDLNSVYDYFDNVVNQLIRSEVDTENFPNLSAFAADLGKFVDKLDDLIEDINPRVDKYLKNREEEERVRQEMEDLQNRLANLKRERQDLVGSQSDDSDGYNSDIFSYDTPTVIGGTNLNPPSVDIVFDTDIEDMMGDTSNLADKALFDDDAADELERKQREEEEAIQREIEEALYDSLTPLDVLSGKLELHERGDDFGDLVPEDDLYDEEEDDDEYDDGEDDGFSFGFALDDDYHYEGDDDEESDSKDDAATSMREQDLFDDDSDAFAGEGGYDDDYRNDDYRDDNQEDAGDAFDDDAWDTDFGGPNIDQLLSSANMTI